jgi:hypothetical protein
MQIKDTQPIAHMQHINILCSPHTPFAKLSPSIMKNTYLISENMHCWYHQIWQYTSLRGTTHINKKSNQETTLRLTDEYF